ncbi:MAG TPA: class I SAM-dependent methyltransferase [Caulobacteraceae bacterium]|nr:class I SAM-dependent methyltransferase [Caulobacteraceae bacterium]
MDKAPLSAFLAQNPFPNGFTDGLFYREKMRAIHAIAPQKIGSAGRRARILDIGGGRSGLAAKLYPDAEVVTVDIDPALAAQAPKGDHAHFICGDACRLPFADGAFDLVSLFDVLEHVERDEAAAAEATRVAASGGAVLLSTPTARWRYPFFAAMKPICPHESELMAQWGHVRRGYEEEELWRLFDGRPERRSRFINPLTAFAHDVAFSRLSRRRRKVLYALAAPVTALGYLLHNPAMGGTEIAMAWRR